MKKLVLALTVMACGVAGLMAQEGAVHRRQSGARTKDTVAPPGAPLPEL